MQVVAHVFEYHPFGRYSLNSKLPASPLACPGCWGYLENNSVCVVGVNSLLFLSLPFKWRSIRGKKNYSFRSITHFIDDKIAYARPDQEWQKWKKQTDFPAQTVLPYHLVFLIFWFLFMHCLTKSCMEHPIWLPLSSFYWEFKFGFALLFSIQWW